MFKRYKISFNKTWDTENEKIVRDSFLAKNIINIAISHNLKETKIVLNDTFDYYAILKGEKLDFLHFVDELLEKVGIYIEKISF